MATGIFHNVIAIQNLTNDITTVSGLMSTSDVQLYRIGNMAVFNFRFKPTNSFPVAYTITHTLPIKPESTTRTMAPKTNATGSVAVSVETNGNVRVYAYGGAYSDWVIGQIFFLVA